MPSPPKPWEVNNNNNTTTSAVPEVPTRSTESTTTPASYGSTGFGSTGYGSTGYGSTGVGGYGSSYGTGVGGYGSSYGTGVGGYGSSYGSGYGTGYGSSYGTGYGSSYGTGYGSSYGTGMYGSGMYGSSMYGTGMYGSSYGGGAYNRMGNNRFGPMGPNDMSLTQKMEMGTRPAFEVVENIVGSFGGFAQMLDSTFMATHSSFMAMVGVAEQLSFLKNYLGQVFSLFAIYRFFKRVGQKVTGKLPTGLPMEINLNEFEKFEKKAAPKMSRKPFVIFMLMVVGLPYLMHKLIKLITEKQQKMLANGPTQAANPLAGIDPAKLEFARAMYDFNPESPQELTLKKGDIVAVISKLDPTTNQLGQWWRGRLRDGAMGLFPANYVEIIQKGGNDSIDEAKSVLKEIEQAQPKEV